MKKTKLYTVIYRQGGWARFRFCPLLPCGREKTLEHVKDLERMGYYTLCHETESLQRIGLPTRFASHYQTEATTLPGGWLAHESEENPPL